MDFKELYNNRAEPEDDVLSQISQADEEIDKYINELR
jgi:hypothetical protein